MPMLQMRKLRFTELEYPPKVTAIVREGRDVSSAVSNARLCFEPSHPAAS